MPGSKNQTARYYLIDECLCSKTQKYWSKEELIEIIQSRLDIRIKERALIYDIYNMRYNGQLKYKAPIKYCQKNKGYHYTRSGYSITKLPLNTSDIQSLLFASEILAQYKNVSILNDFSGVVDKVATLIAQISKKNIDASLPVIDFEKVPFCKGLEHLDPLMDAIKNKKVLKIEYKKFTGEERSYVLHPYLLKEYRNRWYILGLCDKRNSIITLGLDRINKIDNVGIAFRKYGENGFNHELYFANTIGITYQNNEVEDVILSFTPLQAQYLKTQYLHQSQEILEDNENECVIKIRVIPNHELEELILGYGANVKVLEPELLKNKIAKKVKKCNALYK